MKKILTVLMMGAFVVALAIPASGKNTNDTNEGKQEKKVFFFPGGYPHDFILAMDKHFRTRLMEILSIPSSLAKGEVPRMRVATENPSEVLGLYNRLDDPMLGKWR